MGIFGVTCGNCGHRNESGGKFCGECGSALPGSTRKCGNCGQDVSATATFCGQCGKALREGAAPSMVGNRWARREGDFATRVEVSDVEGYFKKGLVIEAGTRALIFTDGACTGVLGAGKYDMGGLLERLKHLFSRRSVTAVLVDAADVELSVAVDGLTTADPLRLTAEARVVVRVAEGDETAFFENLMKGLQAYPRSEIERYLHAEVANALAEFVASRSVRDLAGHLATKQQMESHLARHLAETLKRKGLSLQQVRVANFRHPRMDALTERVEEYWLDRQEMEADAAGRSSNQSVQRRVLDQDTADMLMEVEVGEQQAAVLSRARKAVAAGKMDEIRTQDQFERFLEEQELDRTLRTGLRDDLLKEFGTQQEDRDLKRQHIIRMLRLEQDSVEARAKLSSMRLNGEIEDVERAERMKDLDERVDAARKEGAARLGEAWARAEHDRKNRLGDAETDLTIRVEEANADRIEAEIGLDLLGKIQAIKAQEANQELDRDLRRADSEHAREIQRMAAMSAMSSEALIAMAPKEQAAMLADLKRTEALKGFSEDQILAMAAQNSPEVAKAFQQKFSSAGVERLADEKQRSADAMMQMMERNAQRMQEMFNRGMETQRDTATSAARAQQPGMTVIAPGAPSPGVVQVGGGESAGPRVVVCPTCKSENPVGQKFCVDCGHKFFG